MAKEEEKPEPGAPAEGAPFCTLWIDASGRLRYHAPGVGMYTLVGWFWIMLEYLKHAALGTKPS